MHIHFSTLQDLYKFKIKKKRQKIVQVCFVFFFSLFYEQLWELFAHWLIVVALVTFGRYGNCWCHKCRASWWCVGHCCKCCVCRCWWCWDLHMRNSRLVREAYFQSGLEKLADLFDTFAQTFRIDCGQRVKSVDKQLVCVSFHYVQVFESQIETSAWNHARRQHWEFEFLKIPNQFYYGF